MSRIIWLILVFAGFVQLNADIFQVLQEGPLHEAYVVQEYNTLLNQTVPLQPPQNIKETQPANNDKQLIWLPGYWAWSPKNRDFLWVSGVWRRPPPGHQWVSGSWRKLGDGWVWMRGFWSRTNEDTLTYIASPPPDPVEDQLDELPSSIGDYFWIPGYWNYDNQSDKYVWLSGTWTLPNPRWIYVPPQYIWRERGYTFIPAFWDWPLENRGSVFASVYIVPEARAGAEYRPSKPLNYLVVMQMLFPYWPNYPTLFRYAYFFHNDAWQSWGAAPPWWEWPTWWSYSWSDTWALWWWWTHSGYPNPPWLNADEASLITAPPPFVKNLMTSIIPPVNVTPSGVVSNQQLLDALMTFTGNKTPILPTDPKQILQIQNLALPQIPKPPFLVPQGKEKVTKIPSKISTGAQQNLQQKKQVELPPVPDFSSQLPLGKELGWEKSFVMPPRGHTTLPPHTPEGLHPTQHPVAPPERAVRQPVKPPYLPYENYPTLRMSPYAHPGQRAWEPLDSAHPNGVYSMQQNIPRHPNQFRNQEFLTPYRYQTPMQTEHHNTFMTHPQPQYNPRDPRVYPTPGDYSTLPQQ